MSDALPTILDSLRVRTTIFSRGSFRAPWSVYSDGVPGAIFHAVVDGRCTAVPLDGDAEPVVLETDDILVLSRGQRHVMTSDPELEPVPRGELTNHGGQSVHLGAVESLAYGSRDGAKCEIVCGSFQLDHGAADVLLQLLPPVMHVRPQTQVTPWVRQTLGLMIAEIESGVPGATTVISRLADVLFIHVVRAYVEAMPEAARGWLAGARDPAIARALARIHAEPDQPWTVESLGAAVGMSRSGFHARFSEVVGETPAAYLARWRMLTAADRLRQPDPPSIAALAEDVGYGSEDAFTRAFKREMGVTPARYRRDHAAA